MRKLNILNVVVCVSALCTYLERFTSFQLKMTEKYKHFGRGHFYPPSPPRWLLTCFENLGSMSVKKQTGQFTQILQTSMLNNIEDSVFYISCF